MKKGILLAGAALAFTIGCATHDHHADSHAHQHSATCGHTAIGHENHIDYLHDGHLHATHGKHADEHRLPISAMNPDKCNPEHACSHGKDHQHGANCGHERVPHGDHTDVLVAGHLHHNHANHCDHHGTILPAK